MLIKQLFMSVFMLLAVLFTVSTYLTYKLNKLESKIKKLEADDEENNNNNSSVND